MHFSCIELVEQHGSTRLTRRARHVERVVSSRDVASQVEVVHVHMKRETGALVVTLAMLLRLINCRFIIIIIIVSSKYISGIFFAVNLMCIQYNCYNMHIIAPYTSYGKRLVKNKASQLWNSLPENLKLLQSTSAFKSDLKNYLLMSI